MTVNGSTKCRAYRWCWQPCRFPQDQISWIVETIPSEPKFNITNNQISLIASCYKLSCKFLSLLINLQPSWRRAMYMSNFRFINVKNTRPAIEKSQQTKRYKNENSVLFTQAKWGVDERVTYQPSSRWKASWWGADGFTLMEWISLGTISDCACKRIQILTRKYQRSLTRLLEWWHKREMQNKR